MKKEYVKMLIDALMSIEKIEDIIVSITDGSGIRGKEFVSIENVYEVLWMASKFGKKTDDGSFSIFEETIFSKNLSTDEKYELLFD